MTVNNRQYKYRLFALISCFGLCSDMFEQVEQQMNNKNVGRVQPFRVFFLCGPFSTVNITVRDAIIED